MTGSGARAAAVAYVSFGAAALLLACTGLFGVMSSGRLVRTMLFGLTPTDAVTMAGAILLMVVVSSLAGYLPARRASRVDSLVALHIE